MKKVAILIMSLILTITLVFNISLIAFAQTTGKWKYRNEMQDTESYVNGELCYDIYTKADEKSGGMAISYTGNGMLIDWEFPLLQEGKDYVIISQSKNDIVVKLTNENHNLPYINAIVVFNETTGSSTSEKVQQSTSYSTSATAQKSILSEKDDISSLKAKDSTIEHNAVKENVKTGSNMNKCITIGVVVVVGLTAVTLFVFKKRND